MCIKTSLLVIIKVSFIYYTSAHITVYKYF
jgi:hypothetical protein